MDHSRQERLFAESPGRISPPEPGLYLGTSGWSYADWEGTLYPEGLPAASRLAEYAKHYATVEIAQPSTALLLMVMRKSSTSRSRVAAARKGMKDTYRVQSYILRNGDRVVEVNAEERRRSWSLWDMPRSTSPRPPLSLPRRRL
jgi:hypothetical protein